MHELRAKIDTLRQLSAKAGINIDGVLFTSEIASRNGATAADEQQLPNALQRQPSVESVVSAVSHKSTESKSSRFERGSVKSGASGSLKKGWVSGSVLTIVSPTFEDSTR